MILPPEPAVDPVWRQKLNQVSRLTRHDPPSNLATLVREELGIDLTARYAGISIPHPFGKASGQLSHRLHQVRADVEAGLAFVVLKTVIAEDAAGERTMREWANPETKMRVERLRSASGLDGWTVTWTGWGWAGSLAEYVRFFRWAQVVGNEKDIPIVPSVKFHIPERGESVKHEEYVHTTRQLLEVWDEVGCGGPMVLEKDLSPTLAGDRRSEDGDRILEWLARIPALIEQAAPGRVRLGVKLMNALFDDHFQVDMLRTVTESADPIPAFLVVFNRLFDRARETAYGGWDLSDRNLRVLDLARQHLATVPPLSATGNICSGRIMLEYALRGCENGQVHTFFQLPLSEYTATGGQRTARALHTLLLHPRDGLSVWLRHLHEVGQLEATGGVIRFLDVVEAAGARP